MAGIPNIRTAQVRIIRSNAIGIDTQPSSRAVLLVYVTTRFVPRTNFAKGTNAVVGKNISKPTWRQEAYRDGPIASIGLSTVHFRFVEQNIGIAGQVFFNVRGRQSINVVWH